jgi:hypothetical protein
MATIEQLGEALKRAHEAGDTEAAKVLARAYADARSQQTAAPQPQQQAPQRMTYEAPEPTKLEKFGSAVAGGAELAAQTVVAGAGESLAGLTGLGTLILTGDNDQAAAAIEHVRDAFSWDPLTDGRGAIEGAIAEPLTKVNQALDDFSMWAGFENPIAATAVRTTIEGLPSILGLKKMRLGVRAVEDAKFQRAFKKKQAALGAEAEAMGLSFDNDQIRQSVLNEANKRVQITTRGEGLDELQRELRIAQVREKNLVTQKYNVARAKRALIETDGLEALGNSLVQEMADSNFPLRNMSKTMEYIDQLRASKTAVPGLLDELQPKLSGGTKIKSIRLKDLDGFRQQVRRELKRADPVEAEGLRKIIAGVDKYIDHEFNRRAIRGDATAQQAWLDARGTYERYKANFHEDKVIRDLVQMEATPEMIGRWLLGARTMTGNKAAAKTLDRLKQVLGPTEMEAIKQSVMWDTLQPILNEVPTPANFKSVVKNIDQLLGQNKSMVDSLGINRKDMQMLRRAAYAASFAKDLPQWLNSGFLSMAISRLFFGHEIAKAGLFVKTTNMITNSLFGIGKLSHKQLLKHFASLDLDRPIIPNRTPTWGEVLANGYMAERLQAEGYWDDEEEDKYK